MGLTLIQWNDLRYGHNSTSGNPDKSNSASKEFWNDLFLAEHDKDGDHKSDLTTGLWVVEEGSYTGNGADDRNISLSDAGLDIKYIRIWSNANTGGYVRTENMAGDTTQQTDAATAFLPDRIQSVATTGQFQVGTDADVNTNLQVYFYIVYGVS